MIDPKSYTSEKHRLKLIRDKALKALLLAQQYGMSSERQKSLIADLRAARQALNTFMTAHNGPKPQRYKYSFQAADGQEDVVVYAPAEGVARVKANAILSLRHGRRSWDIELVRVERA